MRRDTHWRFPAAVVAAIKLLIYEESGQDLVEYSLLLTLVSLGVIASVDGLGDHVFDTFFRIARAMATKDFDLR